MTVATFVYEQTWPAAASVGVSRYFLTSHPDLQGQPLRWAVLLVVPAAIIVLHPRVFGPLADGALRAFGRERLPATIPFWGILVMLVYYAMTWAVAGVGVFFVARSVHSVPFSELA